MRVVIAFLLLSSVAHAIDLSTEDRCRNRGGYCLWASLDTLARANNIPSLIGILEQRREKIKLVNDPAYDHLVVEELAARGVRYYLRKQWSFDRSLLEQYANSHGCAVALKEGNPWSSGCHAVVVTSYGNKWVEFYDSSKTVDKNKQPKIWKCGRSWFDKWWLGSSVVVLPDTE